MDDVEDLLAAGALRGQNGTWREDLERNMIGCFNPAENILIQIQFKNGEESCGYHGAYRLYRGGDRCGRQAGLGHNTTGRRIDCGVCRRSGERRGAGLVE